ncbi:MAG: metallophosphoesterase [Verrucomicrobiales bacterium]
MVFLFIIAGIPLFSIAWWIWAQRRLNRLGVSKTWTVVLGVSMAVVLGGFAWILLDRAGLVPARLPGSLYAPVMLWGLLFLPLLAVPSMLLGGLWKGARRIAGRGGARRPASPGEPDASQTADRPVVESDGMSRRRMLGATAVTLPVIATFGTTLTSLPQQSRFRVRDLVIEVPNLPGTLDGLRIAQVSDTHVGKFTNGKVLEELAEATNRLEADLVMLTGDLIDSSLDDLPAAMEMVTAMDRREGLVAIEGNHDLFQGAEEFARGVRSRGVTLLRDEAITFRVRGEAVQILGIRWHGRGGSIDEHVDAVADLREEGAFPILLAHHPHAFDRAVHRGLPLTLAGHTHGGQTMLTPEVGVGPLLFKYWSGLYQRDNSALVVSNGAGNWFPLRTRAPAEIVHLTLRKA